ncbi:MAG: hypothetical protein DRO11_02270 [Methanobacteriota archaeon]|nr:MAG: hypothetical protein DRO11_02270 [Euryarchaeota archaeon]
MKVGKQIPSEKVEPTVEKHLLQSRKYLFNAYKSISDRNYDKASEFLWGATAQIIKALAAKKGIILSSHRDLWDFVEQLAKELEDKPLYDAFFKANALHGNFYEVRLGEKEVVEAAEDIRKLISKILGLIGIRDDEVFV